MQTQISYSRLLKAFLTAIAQSGPWLVWFSQVSYVKISRNDEQLCSSAELKKLNKNIH